MPAVMDIEIGEVREFDGIELVAEAETASCEGCAVRQHAMDTGNIRCQEMGKCVAIVWVQKGTTSARGPYHEAWTAQRRQQREAESNKPRMMPWSDDAVDQFALLQSILARRPDWKKNRETHPIVLHCLETYGRPIDWHLLVLEQPAKSKDQTRLSYYRSDRARSAQTPDGEGTLTVTTMGKYVKRHWPLIKDSDIRDMAERFGPGVLKHSKDMADMIRAAQEGPVSCMRWDTYEDDDGNISYHPDDTDCLGPHPYEVYDPELGWGIAIAMRDGRITGRALTYEKGDVKCFVRSYGVDTDSNGYTGSHYGLDGWLKDKGYEYLEAWPDGVEFAKIQNDNGRYIMPYLDPGSARAGCNDRRIIDGGQYWVKKSTANHDYSFVCDNTDGTMEPPETETMGTCDCCSGRFSEEDLYMVGAQGDDYVCQDCRESEYTVVSGRRGNTYYLKNSEVVTTIDGDHYDSEYLGYHDIVQLHDGQHARLGQCTELANSNGVYVLDDDICFDSEDPSPDREFVEAGDGEVYRLSDMRFCAWNEAWYPKSDMTRVEQGVYVQDDSVADWEEANPEATAEVEAPTPTNILVEGTFNVASQQFTATSIHIEGQV